MAAPPALALDKPAPADLALVNACLDLATKNDDARGPHGPDEAEEAAGPAGRLAAAGKLAATNPANCIGVVRVQCLQATNGFDVDGTESDCATREAAAWDSLLNASYAAALKQAEPAVAANLRKVQRAWIAYRDSSCAQPYITFQGTMAGPIEAYCEMDMTARQALWMRDWAADVGNGD